MAMTGMEYMVNSVRYYLIIAGILVIACVLFAGCSDQSGSGTATPVPTTHAIEANYTAGDIVAKTASQAEPLWLVVRYDKPTDKYERALIFKKSDGSWGYRKDNRTETAERTVMEKVYPVKVAHVTLSGIPVITPTVPTTVTTTPSASAPSVTSITPNNGASGTSVSITDLAGDNFVTGATVRLVGESGSPVVATGVQVTDTKITCTINLEGATAGKYDVIVTNPDGQSDTLLNGFTVNEPAPVITAIDPDEGRIGETLPLSISGSNFKTPAKVFFTNSSAELEAANVVVTSSSRITCALFIPSGTAPGSWSVTVKNVIDQQNVTAVNKFTIKSSS
jgi:hypothetical protein